MGHICIAVRGEEFIGDGFHAAAHADILQGAEHHGAAVAPGAGRLAVRSVEDHISDE